MSGKIEVIKSRMREILASQYGVTPEVVRDDTPIDNLGLDSLDRVEFAIALEEEYGVEIDDDTVYESRTFGEIAKYVKKHLAEKSA